MYACTPLPIVLHAGIVTVMDSKHCMQQLDEKKQDGSVNEATRLTFPSHDFLM